MCDAFCYDSIPRNKDGLAERFARGEDGSFIGREVFGDEYPVGYSVIFCQRDGREIGFALEVV